MAVSSENPSCLDLDESSHSTLAAHLKQVPSKQWWEDASHSFTKLKQLLEPNSKTNSTPQEDMDEETKNMRLIREGSLPHVCILPSGTHALRLTATNEPLQCIVFGTMGTHLFIDLFWEAISAAQDTGAEIAVHEVQRFISRIVLSVASHEFELRYVQCEKLLRTYPIVAAAPPSFLDDPKNCSQHVRNAVKALLSDWAHISPEHQVAYHYIRNLAIHRGCWNTNPGVSAKDFVRICGPEAGEEYINDGFSRIITQFLGNSRVANTLRMAVLDSPFEADWERTLMAVEKEPLHEKLDFPYYIRLSLLYTGSSRAKGAEWLSMVDRKVAKLRERLEARLTRAEVQIWPERLVRSTTDPSDDVYEGYIVIGLYCKDADIPLAQDVSDRWKVQVDEDSISKDLCFIDVKICEGSTDIQSYRLQPDTRVWPKTVVKPDEYRSIQENETGESEKVAKKGKEVPRVVNHSMREVKGARLRPASDVLNRLRYDREYNIDDCIVGYKDRHTSKIKEKPAAEWASETTHEEFIPEHRIEYFKEDGVVMWDKSTRVDKVFKSG